MLTVGIITVSDRATRGRYEDRSGPALKQFCEQRGWNVAATTVVPDEEELIQEKIGEFIQKESCVLVLLTGGTGITERDVTPEAIRAIAAKELPGFGEVMRARSFPGLPNAILSRAMAAVVGPALVICLPGNPTGAVECLEFVVDAIPHAIDLLKGEAHH
ncbi:MAG TPA: MogA/MoaB family molybdenum cofactor biosynthesis protein [Verrucomicrobiae bacterium]|nr:MogA/MoaB family molybdenum cofactor biosynthesis protein [Verrucomicrobiae bacterium]